MSRRRNSQVSRNELDELASMIIAQDQGKTIPFKKRRLLRSSMCKYLLIGAIIALCCGIIPIIYLIYARMGYGRYSSFRSEITALEPILSEKELEVIAELPLPPGNIAVSRRNRIFFNFHPEFRSGTIKIAELHETLGLSHLILLLLMKLSFKAKIASKF
jgi:hypothetical protein